MDIVLNEKDRIEQVAELRETMQKTEDSLEYILIHLSEYLEKYDLQEIKDLAQSYLLQAEKMNMEFSSVLQHNILRVRKLEKAIVASCNALYK